MDILSQTNPTISYLSQIPFGAMGMKNIILKMRILFTLGCICIALGIFMLGFRIYYGAALLGLGIFMLGFWTCIMVVNPELKDYGEMRRRGKN